MFHLAARATSRLTPEALDVAEVFLRALPPFARHHVHSVRLYGPQARRFELEEPFDLFVVVDERSLELRTALSIATAAVESETGLLVQVVAATAAELAAPTPALARAVQNARREGVDLWLRESGAHA